MQEEHHNHHEHHIHRARSLTNLLENKFKIFGVSVGLDPILGLVPWLGDTVALIMSSYLIFIAVRMRLPWYAVLHMGWNIVFDYLVGLVPVIGDIADVTYRANSRNMEIIEWHYNKST
ncbi:MAG: DUF4112 domain-containing protein [Patescibacteria group bacterium]